jgi:hypothetical protein
MPPLADVAAGAWIGLGILYFILLVTPGHHLHPEGPLDHVPHRDLYPAVLGDWGTVAAAPTLIKRRPRDTAW